MKSGKLYNESGAGLLEVLVGMLVIAIGLMGLAPMLALSIDGNSIARDNNVVANLLKEKIEFYEGLPTSSMPSLQVSGSRAALWRSARHALRSGPARPLAGQMPRCSYESC